MCACVWVCTVNECVHVYGYVHVYTEPVARGGRRQVRHAWRAWVYGCHHWYSIYLSIYLSIHLSIYQSIYLSTYLSILPSIHPAFYLELDVHECMRDAPHVLFVLSIHLSYSWFLHIVVGVMYFVLSDLELSWMSFIWIACYSCVMICLCLLLSAIDFCKC